MQQSVHLFIRQHPNDWLTASVLTHPRYAAFGPALGPLKEQLAEVLAHELGEGAIRAADCWLDGLERRTLELTLKAVQHDRLIEVPMRISLIVRPLPGKADAYEVRVPRLGQVFRIIGADNIAPWSEEMIRGHFHLKPVETLLPFQSARGERLERLDVTWQAPKSKVAKRRALKRRLAADDDDDFGWLLGGRSTLGEVGVELVEEARRGRLRRAAFRDDLVDGLVGILTGSTATSALLTGPTGVGKTALVHELAHRIAEGRVPPALADVPVWHVTGGRIIAGMKYLGEWQQRCRQIIDEIRSERGILYVESPYELMTAGSATRGMSVAHFLLPVIRSGEITVIAECTPDGLLLAEQTGPGFIDALRRIPVPRHPPAEALAILEAAAAKLEKQHKVRFTPQGLSRAMDVLARFGDAAAMPGSGLALIEQMARLPGEGTALARAVAGMARMSSESSDDSSNEPSAESSAEPSAESSPKPSARKPERPELGPAAAVRAFARATGMSEQLVDPDVTLDPAAVRAWFDARVIGQPAATALLCDLITVVKASLDDPERPMGSFLFMGPTGVGKTESALTLAEYLFGDRERVIRFDMSEYGHPGAAARLVGVGRSEGDLTRRVREQPFCVLLLDEVEKAGGEVFDVLLQVLGEGRLTDGAGRTVRFTHAIIIMTSNLGASERRAIGLGGSRVDDGAARYREAAQRFFRPEFVNRVDYLVPFEALGQAAVRGIARRMLDAALAREGFARRGVEVTYDDSLIDHLMTHGFDPTYGARPMKRAVEQQVLVPLSKRLVAAGSDAAGQRWALSVADGELVVG